MCLLYFFFFFFNDTATTEIYTLSLHDALPICAYRQAMADVGSNRQAARCLLARATRPRCPRETSCDPLSPTPGLPRRRGMTDRKSTRLNSSHGYISYAVFCLKKKTEDHISVVS